MDTLNLKPQRNFVDTLDLKARMNFVDTLYAAQKLKMALVIGPNSELPSHSSPDEENRSNFQTLRCFESPEKGRSLETNRPHEQFLP